MNTSEKNELLDQLSLCYNRVNYLKILCEEANKPDEAAQFTDRADLLKPRIDAMLRDLYRDWTGNADALKSHLEKTNQAVEKCVVNIERDFESAQNIAAALDYVDHAIRFVADVVP